ncbi:TIR domain-containing protein [Bacillus cereus]|uniref:TIR domain-containing protein n=1 Tax=Bacillus cereus TaxID=1396 RepID=UPI000BF8FEA5|nr:TIR domain-containing protein [Bacillus cereus]MDZ4530160.1 TIR domain-containing protein [Bacillus cereus]PFK82535.1 molecular chaperone Tir [Bacillus cereus]HDZ3280972.1 TIR domain-containing protein [Bacillus cereus]
MAYRNKTYICFDGDEDMHYYLLIKAWKAKDGKEFNFHNAHDLYPMQKSKLDDNDEAYIKRKLHQRFLNTKCLMVLVGQKTKNLYKYVRWEIDVALQLDIPILVVNLNKKNGIDRTLCPATLRKELALHIPYSRDAIVRGIDNWPDRHKIRRKQQEKGPHYYKDLDPS